MRQWPVHRDFEANQSGSNKHFVLVDTDIGHVRVEAAREWVMQRLLAPLPAQSS